MTTSDLADFYTGAQRAMQDRFDSRPLADALAATIVTDEISEDQAEFIATRDFFFLATVNDRGEPTVSYKGGGVGTVTVINPRTIAFPIYDGNGMFLSVGNIDATSKIGMLFIDFETPKRVRLQVEAVIHPADSGHALLEAYPGAIAVALGTVTAAFVNCARYIHPHDRIATSKYVPNESGEQPVPAWKRIDLLQGFLSDVDQERTSAAGGTITGEEYGALLDAGES